MSCLNCRDMEGLSDPKDVDKDARMIWLSAREILALERYKPVCCYRVGEQVSFIRYGVCCKDQFPRSTVSKESMASGGKFTVGINVSSKHGKGELPVFPYASYHSAFVVIGFLG